MLWRPPDKDDRGQEGERQRDRVLRGHFRIFDQHDAQINQCGNGGPGCVDGYAVLNLSGGGGLDAVNSKSPGHRTLGQKNVNFLSHQRAVEPQVDFVVLAEPRSVKVEAVAGVGYHHVVGQRD